MQNMVIMHRLSYRGRLEDVSDGLAAANRVVSGLFASPYGLNAALRRRLSVSCQPETVHSISLPLFTVMFLQSHSHVHSLFLRSFSFSFLNLCLPYLSYSLLRSSGWRFIRCMPASFDLHERETNHIIPIKAIKYWRGTDFGSQLIHLLPNLLHKSFGLSFLLPFFPRR